MFLFRFFLFSFFFFFSLLFLFFSHYIFFRCFQGGESAAIAAVSACLSVLVVLERERSTYVIATPSSTAYSPPSTGQPGLSDSLPSAVAECGGARPATHRGHRGRSSGFLSPEVKLYYLANACMYGAAVLSGATAETNFGWLLTRCGCYSKVSLHHLFVLSLYLLSRVYI